MNKFTFTLVCLSTILLYCCNSDVNSGKKSRSESAQISESVADKPVDPKLRSQALGILDHRIKNDPTAYAIIEAGVLNYLFVFNGKEMSKPNEYDGKWIDYKADFTYDYGEYGTTEGGGRYHYSMDEGQLVMVDNDPTKNPQEWDIKSGGDMVIKIGSKTYGNNAFQIKLERSDDFPIK